MSTSQNNVRRIEKYLYNKLSPVDKLIFESKLASNPGLRLDLYFQKKTYRLIKMYHREQMKNELETLHQSIFKNPDNLTFRQYIYQLFKKKPI
jgi:hypothetical protein